MIYFTANGLVEVSNIRLTGDISAENVNDRQERGK